MKNKKLTGFLVDVMDELTGPITIDNSLESLYSILNCALIDITYLTLGKKEFCVIVDDEGLLESSPKISAVSVSGRPMLVGNLMLVSADGGEDFASLAPDDIRLIEEHIRHIATSQNPYPYPALCNICC